MRVAVYARYSSENQRDASIADQFRVCREFAGRQGWRIEREYSDHAVSGAALLRPGFQAFMAAALRKEFDVVLAEALDRFSRDQEDTAGLFKRLTCVGVRIVTLAEGDITHLHIGFKGTMNALFLKDLAEKTHRGDLKIDVRWEIEKQERQVPGVYCGKAGSSEDTPLCSTRQFRVVT